MVQPFIRAFNSKDKDEMIVIFNDTADSGLRSKGPEALRIGAHTYCFPYFTLQPENCFVVDDGNGKVVGYIIGTPDNHKFAKQWRDQYIPMLETHGIVKPESGDDDPLSGMRLDAHSPEEKLLGPPNDELLRNYPGHLHIDIRPGWQGQGLGVQLMDAFLNNLHQQGCKGIHLGMLATNEGAERFYYRVGFGRFPQIMDGGTSGEQGTDGRVVYMVKSL